MIIHTFQLGDVPRGAGHTLVNVHTALAYYWDTKDFIDRQKKESGESVNQLKSRLSQVKQHSCSVRID